MAFAASSEISFTVPRVVRIGKAWSPLPPPFLRQDHQYDAQRAADP
jgi:hypothetical protein